MQNASQAVVSISEKDKARFWSKVDIRGEDECWLWIGNIRPNGYGRFYANSIGIPAHRAAWIITNGAIAENMCACHSCDIPLCVNPSHLWIGTHHDNASDRVKKGRSATGGSSGSRLHPEALARGLRNGKYTKPESTLRGEEHGMAILTEGIVKEMREMHSRGMKFSKIRRHFGATKNAVRKCIVRETWKHIK